MALERDLVELKSHGFRVLPLPSLIDQFLAGTLNGLGDEPVCAITFDDGVLHDFADFYHPDQGLLKSFARILSDAAEAHLPGWASVPATSFVIASPDARALLDVECIAGRDQWHDHWWQEAIDDYHFDIGNHSWNHTHPCLPEVQAVEGLAGNFHAIDRLDRAQEQILQAEAYLSQKLGDARSRLFAYPYGHVSQYLRDEFFPQHADQFKAAIATGGAYFCQDSPRWAIPRFVCGEDWNTPEAFTAILSTAVAHRSKRIARSTLLPISNRDARRDSTRSHRVLSRSVEQQDNDGRAGTQPLVPAQTDRGSEAVAADPSTSPPFFLLGCVRSGTTLLRDLLKQHPHLHCAEETHLFRWPHPFGSGDFNHIQQHNETLRAHRQIDGVSEERYAQLLAQSVSRRDLQDGYARLFFEAKGIASGRWFDKTPQNVYGLLLLSAEYPESKFIHIVRHPLNVVTSLKAGEVMAPHTLQGAINTWLEAVTIIRQYEIAWPQRLHTVRYEALAESPQSTMAAILDFIGESSDQTPIDFTGVYPERNRYEQALTASEVSVVRQQLSAHMAHFGYT